LMTLSPSCKRGYDTTIGIRDIGSQSQFLIRLRQVVF
jgi:hypothetical protein